ncbi:MAG: hypothetical protein AABW49_00205 [Nanoarchaeota archaeon]
MSWFSKKEKKEEKKSAELAFPVFHSQLSDNEDGEDIKNAISPPPKIIPAINKEKSFRPLPKQETAQFVHEQYSKPEYYNKSEEFSPVKPAEEHYKPVGYAHETIKQGKTIFVRVEQYEDATAKIEVITQQLKKAEESLGKIDELRSQESKELEQWKQDLDGIKTKLKLVDRALFGQ